MDVRRTVLEVRKTTLVMLVDLRALLYAANAPVITVELR